MLGMYYCIVTLGCIDNLTGDAHILSFMADWQLFWLFLDCFPIFSIIASNAKTGPATILKLPYVGKKLQSADFN